MTLAIRFLIRLLAAFIPLIIVMALPAPLQIVVLVAAVAGITIMTTNHRFNFAGHVRMAAAEEAGLAAVQERLVQAIEATRRTSKKTVVVAHSQGGYLAYRALENLQLTNITLITVGSGLRPITTLRVMGSRPRYVLGCWGALVGLLVVEGWLLTHFDPGQTFSPFTQMGIDPGLLFAGLVVGEIPPELGNSATPAGMMKTFWDSLPRIDIDWWLLGAAVAYFMLFIILRRWGNEFVQAVRIPALRRTEWIDITTHHDLVGRLTVPALPSGVEEKAVVVTGNGLADHVRYLNKPGLTSWIIAERITAGLGHQADPKVEAARLGALARSSRRHSLRATALVVPLLFLGMMALVVGGDPMAAMITAVPDLIWLFLPLSVFVWIADTRDSRQVVEALSSQDTPRPPPETTEPRRADAVILIFVAMTAAMSALVVHGLLRELNLLHLGDGLVTALMLWTLAALSLATAVAAGYRPPPAKVTVALIGVTFMLALAAWRSVAPFYPQHLPPLGLLVLVVLASSTFAALVGFAPLRARVRRLATRLMARPSQH